MEFLAFEDGTLRDERYRKDEIVEEPFHKTRKVYIKQPSVSNTKYGEIQEIIPQEGLKNFSFNPKNVIFENFTVGEVYSIIITLTNCTNHSTSFRVLPISPKYKDAIHIDYVPPPKLSPGLSWKVKIIFIPVENIDLETSIALKSDEGIFLIPIKAVKKRAILSILPEYINFGVVIFGEKVTKILSLKNDGALPAKVFVSGSLRKLMEIFHKNLQNGEEFPVISIKPVAYQIIVNPFSTYYLEVTFSPHKNILIDAEIELRYESEDEIHIKKIPVKGSGGSLPVYISSFPEIDFNWCFYDNTYCEKITITNATNVSVEVTPEIPPMMNSSLVFSPETARVQANNTFDIFISFTPQRGLDFDVSSLIKMNVSGQASPISVLLKAQITERGFTIEPNKLDYGVCGIDQEIVLPLKVKNLSDLPQIIGFLKIPNNVNIKPFQTITMLPREIIEFKIGVRPPTLGQYTQVIKITNEYGDSKSIQLTGCGREYNMKFSKPCVNLPACPINGEISCTTILQNKSSLPQRFFLFSPIDVLKVSPSSGILKPWENLPIVIIFKPPNIQPIPSLTIDENISRSNIKSSLKKSKEKEVQLSLPDKNNEKESISIDNLYKEWESNSNEEEWSRHSTFFIKCTDGTEYEKNLILLQINCTVIKPSLVAKFLSRTLPKPIVKKENLKRNIKKSPPIQNLVDQTPVLEISSSETHLYIEFGEVPLKHQAERVCLLCYNGMKSITLNIRPINTISPFKIVKPPPFNLSENEECSMVIRFIPTEYGSYKEKIIITSIESNDITLSLSGVCRPADLFISKNRDIGEGRIQSIDKFIFDAVLIGQENKQQLFFHNFSSLPIEVNSKFLTEEGKEPEWPEIYSFIIEHDKFTIPGNSKTSTNIIFFPKSLGILRLSLNITAGAFEHNILLEGRACDKPVYFAFPENKQLSEVNYKNYLGLQSHIFPSQGISLINPVQFHCIAEESKIITVGCVKLGPNFECTVNGWSESYLESGWKLEPMKANITSGGNAVFTLSYNPKKENGDVSFCTFYFATKSSQQQAETVYYVRCTGTM